VLFLTVCLSYSCSTKLSIESKGYGVADPELRLCVPFVGVEPAGTKLVQAALQPAALEDRVEAFIMIEKAWERGERNGR